MSTTAARRPERSWSAIGSLLVTLLTDHALPGVVYLFATIGNVLLLGEIAAGAGPAAGLDPTAQSWLFVQRALFAGFLALIALLFIIRRRTVGEQAGLITAIGKLALHPGNAGLRGDVGRRIIPALVALAGTNAMALQGFFPVTRTAPEVTIPAAGLEAVGIVLSFVSLASLGRCFGVFPEVRGLVTRGPYALVRHPLYLAEIIASLGALLPTISVPTLGVFILFVLLQYRRARYEEVALAKVFPEYEPYTRRTWRILPGLH